MRALHQWRLFCSYAYLECANEKIAYEMSEKYKDTEINGEKLYVIQAISDKKDKFGQLWHVIFTRAFMSITLAAHILWIDQFSHRQFGVSQFHIKQEYNSVEWK